MKKKPNLVACALTLAILGAPVIAHAEEDPAAELEKAETIESTAPADATKWESSVKERYALTDEQMKSLKDAGLKGPQLATTAALAKASGKPLDEVIRMRTEQKMGWGRIAKELGVEPKTIGQSVRDTRHSIRDARREKREERREARLERKEERREKRQERREERQQRRKARAGH